MIDNYKTIDKIVTVGIMLFFCAVFYLISYKSQQVNTPSIPEEIPPINNLEFHRIKIFSTTQVELQTVYVIQDETTLDLFLFIPGTGVTPYPR